MMHFFLFWIGFFHLGDFFFLALWIKKTMWYQVLCSWQVLTRLWTQHAGDLTQIKKPCRRTSFLRGRSKIIVSVCFCPAHGVSLERCGLWRNAIKSQGFWPVFDGFGSVVWEGRRGGKCLKTQATQHSIICCRCYCPEREWPELTSGFLIGDLDFLLSVKDIFCHTESY